MEREGEEDLDASKAFDRVNHWCLLKKNLINRDIPITIIRLLVRMVLRKEEFFLRRFLM